MDSAEKAKIRMEHWIGHNHNHLEDYEKFALELESMGKSESAASIREMAELAKKSNACLQRALDALQ